MEPDQTMSPRSIKRESNTLHRGLPLQTLVTKPEDVLNFPGDASGSPMGPWHHRPLQSTPYNAFSQYPFQSPAPPSQSQDIPLEIVHSQLRSDSSSVNPPDEPPLDGDLDSQRKGRAAVEFALVRLLYSTLPRWVLTEFFSFSQLQDRPLSDHHFDCRLFRQDGKPSSSLLCLRHPTAYVSPPPFGCGPYDLRDFIHPRKWWERCIFLLASPDL